MAKHCSVEGCTNVRSAKGLCQKHYIAYRKGVTFKVTSLVIPKTVIAANKRRCQAFMSNGTQCLRAKEGARKLCRAHDKEMSDRRVMDLRADLEIPPREPWVYEGDEESLIEALEG